VFAVGITGHRQDALPPEPVAKLSDRLRDVLALLARQALAIHSRNRDLFSPAPPRLLFVSPLADGADQVAAEVALDLGFELHAVLPFDRDRTRDDLPDEQARERFDSLLGRALCVLELPGEEERELDAYVMAGRATIAHSDVLNAVWDGRPPRGRGGTGEVVRFAFERATPIVHVPPAEGEPVRLRWAAFEPAIVSGHDDHGIVRNFGESEVASALAALLGPPADPRERGFIRQFQEECRRRRRVRVEYPLLLAAAGVSRFSRRQWRNDLCEIAVREEWRCFSDACVKAEAAAESTETLQPWYEWADGLAGHFAQSYRSGHVFNFVLGAFAVMLALTALLAPAAKPYLAAIEFAAVLAILLNTWLGNRHQWHRRWLDYRQLAERLRPMRSLKLLGIATPDPPGTQANPVSMRWVEWYASTIWRAMGCPTGRIDRDKIGNLSSLIVEHEIAPQVAYHRSNSRQAEKLDRRLEVLGYGLFAATLAAIAVLLAAIAVDPHWASERLALFTFLTAGLPAIGTAIFGIRVQGDYIGSSVRSEHTALRLEHIAERLEGGTSLGRAADLLEQAARTMLADLDEWRLLNQQHDLSVG